MARNIRFDRLIARGEANTPDGFKGQSANGSLRATSTGWNRQWDWDYPTEPTVEPKGPWRAGRSNRSGE